MKRVVIGLTTFMRLTPTGRQKIAEFMWACFKSPQLRNQAAVILLLLLSINSEREPCIDSCAAFRM